MARLVIVFDPNTRICLLEACDGIKHASLDIADDIEAQDIYAIARKLADLLMEQIR